MISKNKFIAKVMERKNMDFIQRYTDHAYGYLSNINNDKELSSILEETYMQMPSDIQERFEMELIAEDDSLYEFIIISRTDDNDRGKAYIDEDLSCNMEGCNGSQYVVLWGDGEITIVCGKSLKWLDQKTAKML